jgi:uncharacterized protein (UPF0261 family)
MSGFQKFETVKTKFEARFYYHHGPDLTILATAVRCSLGVESQRPQVARGPCLRRRLRRAENVVNLTVYEVTHIGCTAKCN